MVYITILYINGCRYRQRSAAQPMCVRLKTERQLLIKSYDRINWKTFAFIEQYSSMFCLLYFLSLIPDDTIIFRNHATESQSGIGLPVFGRFLCHNIVLVAMRWIVTKLFAEMGSTIVWRCRWQCVRQRCGRRNRLCDQSGVYGVVPSRRRWDLCAVFLFARLFWGR